MKAINIIVTAIAVCQLYACDKMLSSEPNRNTAIVPSTVEDLESLLNNYIELSPENNRTFVCSTDDYDILREIYQAKNNIYKIATAQFATWDKEQVQYDADESFWQGEYKKIFTANMILYYLPRVDGDEKIKENLRLEALFLRAYSLNVLAQTYCLPYSETTRNEPGLVLKESIDFNEEVTRATLEQTYHFIENDLKEALKLEVKMKTVNNYHTSWRASKAAVNAFAARFYLGMNNYDAALKYADIALSEHNKMMNYNVDMRFSDIVPILYVNGVKEEFHFPYTHDNRFDQPTDMMGWKELYYFRFLVNETVWYTPSKALINMYDKEYDLRYKYHFVQNYSYDRGVVSPAYKYPGYVFFDLDRVPAGPTVAEMLLIKSEVLARSGNINDAMTVVNILRENRMDQNAPAERKYLSADNKDEAIRQVLAERRRELPFSQRWPDIRRFNHNEYPGDDIEILEREFYEYTESRILGDFPKNYQLRKGSRRFAAPIPQEDIQMSNGSILQNTY